MIASSLAPTPEDRRAIEARRTQLRDAMQPAHPNEIEFEIDLMRAGFPLTRMDDASAELTTRVYVSALAGTPAWVVREARKRFQTGRNEMPWKPGFCPTSAEMAIECRAIMAPVQDEAVMVARVLDAEVYAEQSLADAQRAEVVRKAWTDTARRELKPAATEDKEPPAVKLERLKIEFREPLKISKEFAKILDDMKIGRGKDGIIRPENAIRPATPTTNATTGDDNDDEAEI